MSSTAKFTMQTTMNGSEAQIEMIGYINEFATFTPLTAPASIVKINLRGVNGLNSVGTRNWCQYLATLKPPTKIILDGCPVIVVKALNQVEGAFPANADVNSFLVPFISDASGQRLDVLFANGTHFSPKGELKVPEVKDAVGNAMDMDIIPEVYFSFLKRYDVKI